MLVDAICCRQVLKPKLHYFDLLQIFIMLFYCLVRPIVWLINLLSWPVGSLSSSIKSAVLLCYYTEWAKKTAHGFHCNNFVNSQSIFIIFGTYTL